MRPDVNKNPNTIIEEGSMNNHYTKWGKDWADRNKDVRKAYRAKWYKDNQTRIREQQKEYRFKRDLSEVTGESNE